MVDSIYHMTLKLLKKGTATLMITVFYMTDFNKPQILIPVSSKSKCVIKIKDKPMDYLQLSLIKHFPYV